ncbi:hypothetical protein VCV18_008852 [Metarhizium anisopliae]
MDLIAVTDRDELRQLRVGLMGISILQSSTPKPKVDGCAPLPRANGQLNVAIAELAGVAIAPVAGPPHRD